MIFDYFSFKPDILTNIDVLLQTETESYNYDFNEILDLISQTLKNKNLETKTIDINSLREIGALNLGDFLKNTYSAEFIREFCKDFDLYNKSVLSNLINKIENGKTIYECINDRFTYDFFKRIDNQKENIMKEIIKDPKYYNSREFDKKFDLVDEVFIDDEIYKYFVTGYLIFNIYQLITIYTSLKKIQRNDKYQIIDKYSYDYFYIDIIKTNIYNFFKIFIRYYTIIR